MFADKPDAHFLISIHFCYVYLKKIAVTLYFISFCFDVRLSIYRKILALPMFSIRLFILLSLLLVQDLSVMGR